MTKAKKVLSLVLAVVMMFGVMSVIAFANDAPNPQAGKIVLEYDKTSYAAGETITVTAKLTTDYYAAATGIPLQFDAAAVDYVSTAKGALFGSVDATEMAVNHLTEGGKDFVYAAFSPLSARGAVAQICNDVVLLTATFRAKTAINDTKAVFGILDDQKTMSHLMGKLYVGAFESSDVKSTVYTTGQTLDFPKMTAGPTEPNTLKVKDSFVNASSVIVDKYAPEFFVGDTETTGVIYGIETIGYYDGFTTMYALSEALTTTLGDEYLVITASNIDEGYESTGTKIEVLDTDRVTVLETYYFVYFGDVNGDGYVDNGDATACETYALNDTTLTNIFEILAGDANGDTYTDNGDATAISTCALNDADYVSQEAIAELFYNTISADYGI